MGGSDNSYSYITGPDAAGHNPGDDLSAYNVPGGYQYIFQGHHQTQGGYVDTLDFNIRETNDKVLGAYVTAFTIANIHGALGDNGQMYKQLAFMLKDGDFKTKGMTKFVGCGDFK